MAAISETLGDKILAETTGISRVSERAFEIGAERRESTETHQTGVGAALLSCRQLAAVIPTKIDK